MPPKLSCISARLACKVCKQNILLRVHSFHRLSHPAPLTKDIEYFIFKLAPLNSLDNDSVLRLGKARPFNMGSTTDTSGNYRLQTDRNVHFIAPPDGWYAVKVGRIPGVYRGWTNTICSALAGLGEDATEWKYFPLREEAIAQYLEWAAANELEMLNADGTYRASFGTYVDLDRMSDSGSQLDDEETETTSLLRDAVEAHLKELASVDLFSLELSTTVILFFQDIQTDPSLAEWSDDGWILPPSSNDTIWHLGGLGTI
ncbi:hypothetical protein C8J56DRAFT_901221 [Mycena floridula]|nr:hypothetical protein C8J56DRAFT_901221 [Mycena floridula]